MQGSRLDELLGQVFGNEVAHGGEVALLDVDRGRAKRIGERARLADAGQGRPGRMGN